MKVKNKIWDFLWSQEWNIGFFKSQFDSKQSLDISWMKSNYRDGWFADPFILDIKQKEIEVLVEEYNYNLKRGRIDLLTVSQDDYSLKDIKVLLEKPTHLSFPAIFRHRGKIYVYPENSEAGCLVIYEYNLSTKRLDSPRIILRDSVVDAIIRYDHVNNEYLLFATKFGSLEDNQNLLVYRSNTLDKEFVFAQKIKIASFGARGAGDWIEEGERLFRPSQDGKNLNEYGKGIIISEVSRKDYTHMKEVSRIYPTSSEYPLGIHTINQFGEQFVVDGLKYKRPLLGKYSWNFKNIIQNGSK